MQIKTRSSPSTTGRPPPASANLRHETEQQPYRPSPLRRGACQATREPITHYLQTPLRAPTIPSDLGNPVDLDSLPEANALILANAAEAKRRTCFSLTRCPSVASSTTRDELSKLSPRPLHKLPAFSLSSAVFIASGYQTSGVSLELNVSHVDAAFVGFGKQLKAVHCLVRTSVVVIKFLSFGSLETIKGRSSFDS